MNLAATESAGSTSPSGGPLPTAHSRKRPPPEVIVFVDPTKRRKNSSSQAESATKALKPGHAKVAPQLSGSGGSRQQPQSARGSSQPVINLTAARYEVYKLGVTGLSDNAKEDAKIAHAIRLGAKPPKNKYVNYKLLQEEKRKERERERLAEELIGMQSKKANVKKKTTSEKKKADTDFGQLGRYKNGVQILSKADIVKITGKR